MSAAQRLLLILLLIALALAAYLGLAPVPIQPVAWQAPPAPGYTGPHAPNNRLAGLETFPLGRGHGPEHAVFHEGWIYTGLSDGTVVRVLAGAAPGTAPEVVLDTDGRPLGLDFDADGRLLIADAMRGLLRATLTSGGAPARIEPLVTSIDEPTPGDPIRYADAVLAGPNGTIYFTDASRRFAPADWEGTFHASVLDTLEHSCTGRLLAYDPQSRYTRVMLRGLCFPNGLALTLDGRQLLVSETGLYRILKAAVNIQGLSMPQALQLPGDPVTVLLDNLPGFPDNLMRGQGEQGQGRVWVGLTKPRSRIVDFAAEHPWIREVTLRLPRALWPVPPAYGHVIAFDDRGRILADLQDPAGSYPEATAVTETADRLYIQSLHASRLGWLDKRAAGF